MRLAPEEVALLRKDATDLLTGTCDILRATRVGNQGGSSKLTWATVATDLPCRLAPESGVAGVSNGREDERSGLVATLPHDSGLRTTDRLEADGTVYEVLELPPRNVEERFVVRARVKAVDP